MDFEDALQDWKDREDHADALILLQDMDLLKYAGLWRKSIVAKTRSYLFDSTWRDLWECVQVDHALLADLADETEARAIFQVRRLRELRLIYPDGTRSDMATRAISKFMANALG